MPPNRRFSTYFGHVGIPAFFAAAHVVVPSAHETRQAWKSITVRIASLGPSPCSSGASTENLPHICLPHMAGIQVLQNVPVVVTIEAMTWIPQVSLPAGQLTLADSPLAVVFDQLYQEHEVVSNVSR